MARTTDPDFDLAPFDPADTSAALTTAAALLEIYAPIVRDTAISFEREAPDAAEFAGRLASFAATHSCWIARDGDGPIGYAYAAAFRQRVCYDWSVETSVYLHPRARGRGLARALMERVIADCRRQGRRLAIAGIVLPTGCKRSRLHRAPCDPRLPENNRPSVELHERLGFRFVGRFKGVGSKFGRCYDVGFWQLPLGRGD